ncbi:MAG: DUF1178 family protein [Methyloligellaceae bacterium]
MIRYTLKCGAGHSFEAWFASSEAFDEQAGAGEVACPECGSREVSKAVMAPNIAAGSKGDRNRHVQEALLRLARKYREHVERTAENVGPRFAEEARKIHYRESEPRGIFGSATESEVKALLEEGVEFHPLPALPEDHN